MKILIALFLISCAVTGAVVGVKIANRTTGVALGIRGES